MGQREVRSREPRMPRPARFARLRHRWFMWRNYRVRWVGTLWSFMWTRGSFARRFWTVVIIGLAVYVAADLIVAAATS